MSVFLPMRERSKSGRAIPTSRWWGLLALCVVCFGSVVAAQDKKDKEKPIEDKTIQSPADGWPLRLTYYRSIEGKEAAVVVLLHMKNESRLVWSAPSATAPKGFAKQLNDKGLHEIALKPVCHVTRSIICTTFSHRTANAQILPFSVVFFAL